MKVLVGLNKKDFSDYLNYANSFIIGLKEYSINYCEFSLEEIKKIREKYPKIELFISLNKNIFNSDLDDLEEKLKELDKLNIQGLLFYDLSILYLVQKNHLTIPLIWGQEHMTTNYNTCNYYYDKGCQYVYLASEITEEEIKEIKEHSKMKLISFLFGYPDVSFSRRKLITNYFLHHNTKKEKEFYTIGTEDSEKYFIKESPLGTRILYGNILNGVYPFVNLFNTLDYGIVSEEFLEHEIFIKCLKVFHDLEMQKVDKDQAWEMIKDLTESIDTVFYYRKTIYKVKDEK